MQFCLFARFFACFRFSLQCFKQTNKIAFLAAFLAVSRVFLSFVCVCLCKHKKPLFWPLLAVNFLMHPQPLIDPHRDRGCLSELFFLKFFFYLLSFLCVSRIFFLKFFLFALPLLPILFFLFFFFFSPNHLSASLQIFFS